MIERENIRASAQRSTATQAEEWQALDGLPRSVRRALHEAGMNWCSAATAAGYTRALHKLGWHHAEHATVQNIRTVDAAERQRFADAFEAETGTPYPARAAASTMTRYDRRAA